MPSGFPVGWGSLSHLNPLWTPHGVFCSIHDILYHGDSVCFVTITKLKNQLTHKARSADIVISSGTSAPSSPSSKMSKMVTEKVYFRSQILERPSIGESWNIFNVPVLPESVIFMFFRTCWCYSEAYNSGTQKWSSIVQYSCTSIWDLKYTFSMVTFGKLWDLCQGPKNALCPLFAPQKNEEKQINK